MFTPPNLKEELADSYDANHDSKLIVVHVVASMLVVGNHEEGEKLWKGKKPIATRPLRSVI